MAEKSQLAAVGLLALLGFAQGVACGSTENDPAYQACVDAKGWF